MSAEWVDEAEPDGPELRIVLDDSAHPEPDHDPGSWPTNARRSLGVGLLGLALASRFASGQSAPLRDTSEDLPARAALDVGLGLLDLVLEGTQTLLGTCGRVLNPVLAQTLEPGLRPVRGVSAMTREMVAGLTAPLAARGARLRQDSEKEATAAVAAVLPGAMDTVLDQIELTDQVIGRVDLERVLADTFEQVDVVNIMIDKVDLAPVVHASLAEVDLTDVAVSELDFERVVRETLERVDVVALMLEQMDPARIAAFLNENVDVAEMLRTSPTGAVRGVMDTVGKMVPGRTQ